MLRTVGSGRSFLGWGTVTLPDLVPTWFCSPRVAGWPVDVYVDFEPRSNAHELHVECEQEVDGRWLAEVIELPGVLTYGATKNEAIVKAETLALRVIAERLEQGEANPTSMRKG
jgi:predicted RNase H-like HicB family nuclease